MALSPCNTTVDGSRRELIEHGTAAFPVACYHDDLGKGEVPWHWHEELEAVVIASGCCTVAAGKEKFTVRTGEGFFINSQILHGCWDLDGSSCRFHSLVFHPRLVGGSSDSVFHQKFLRPLTQSGTLESIRLSPDVLWQRQALEAIEAAWQAGCREGLGYELRMRNSLSDLILLLHENVREDRPQSGSRENREGERIKQMIRYIHDHYGEPVKMGDIAWAARISESECLRCFRSTIGTTPIAYLRRYRVQRAAQLLAGTRMPVAAVAESCGFSDVSYFTKTFRELKGMAPAAYRRKKQRETAP